MLSGYLNKYDEIQKDVDNSHPFFFNPTYFVADFKETSVVLKDCITHFITEVSFEDLVKNYKRKG